MDLPRSRDSTPMPLYQLTCVTTRGGNSDLLPKHRSHRNLKSVPPTGSSKPRSSRNQWSQEWIRGQMIIDRLDIRAEVKKSSNPVHDARQESYTRYADSHLETCVIGLVRHLDGSDFAVDFDSPEVAP